VTPKKENQLDRDHPPDSRLDELRGLAEDILRRRPREAVQPEDDRVLELIHELEVHQIELRLQNEELIATQEDLARTSERYQDLFEFAPVGYLIFDQNGKVTEANLTLAMMLEQERQYLLKFGLSPFLDPENLSRLVRHRQQVLEKGAAEPCELKFTPKDLPVKWVHLDSRPIRDEAERITGYRSTLTDITARKKLEEERENTLELIGLLKTRPMPKQWLGG
jgi:PAS domain S-box-containing protein